MNQADATVTTSRDEELEEAVANMRIGGLHGPEARALAIGAILLVVSVLLVLAGWWGASGTIDVGEQVPYVVSGGLAGVAVAVVGAVVFLRFSLGRYLRYWLIRLLHEQREQSDRLITEQQRQADRLVEVLERLESAVKQSASPRV